MGFFTVVLSLAQSASGAVSTAELKKQRSEQKKKWLSEHPEPDKPEPLQLIPELAGVEMSELVKTGDCAHRVDIAFISCGFTEKERGKFEKMAKKYVATLPKLSPWNRYRNYINYHSIWAPNYNNELTGSARHGLRLADTILSTSPTDVALYAQAAPDCDLPVVIVNSRQGRACAFMMGDFYSHITVAGNDDNIVLAHELGHAWGLLADEYVETARFSPSQSMQHSEWMLPNIDETGDWRKAKWFYWNMPENPNSRTLDSTVDCFEGANLAATGWWRPSRESLMRDHRKCKDYNAPSLESVERRFYELISPIDDYAPRKPFIAAFKDEKVRFEVSIPNLAGDWNRIGKVTAIYTLDGEEVKPLKSEKSACIELECGKLEPGFHNIVAYIFFDDHNVRRDGGYLEDARFWRLYVAETPAPVIKLEGKTKIGAGEALELNWNIAKNPLEKGRFTLLYPAEGADFSANGCLRWTPPSPGKYIVRVRYGNEKIGVIREVGVNVKPARKGKRPVLIFIPNFTIIECSKFETDLSANDVNGEHVAYSIKGLPDGASFDRNSGQISWQTGLLDAGEYKMEVTAENSAGKVRADFILFVREFPLTNFTLRLVARKNARPDIEALEPFVKNVLVLLRFPNKTMVEAALESAAGFPPHVQLMVYTRLMRCRWPELREKAAKRLEELFDNADKKTGKQLYNLLATMLGRSLSRYVMYPGKAAALHELLEQGHDSGAYLMHFSENPGYRMASGRWEQMDWFWKKIAMKR